MGKKPNLSEMVEDLRQSVGDASPVNKQDMSDEKRVSLITQVLSDHLGSGFDVSVRHMGHYDRVLVSEAKRKGKLDK